MPLESDWPRVRARADRRPVNGGYAAQWAIYIRDRRRANGSVSRREARAGAEKSLKNHRATTALFFSPPHSLLRLPPDRAQPGRLAPSVRTINARARGGGHATFPLHRSRRNVQDVAWRDRSRPVHHTRGVLTLPHHPKALWGVRRGRREFHRLSTHHQRRVRESRCGSRSGDTQTERNALEYALSRAQVGIPRDARIPSIPYKFLHIQSPTAARVRARVT